jgi:hypothetical protein
VQATFPLASLSMVFTGLVSPTLAINEEVRHAAAGVATLPGSAFGQGEDVLALRIATSLLYGLDDEQRLSALHHESPASLPWIKGQLDAIAAALQALLHDR